MQKWYIKQLVSSLHESARSEENHWYCCHPNSDIHSIWYATGKKLSSLTTYPLSPPKDAAGQRSVVSAWPAGEGPGAEGHTLFTLSASISVWLLWGCFGEQQPKRKCGGRGTKGNFKKGSRSKVLSKKTVTTVISDIKCGFWGIRINLFERWTKNVAIIVVFLPFLCLSPPERFVNFWHKRRTPSVRSTGCIWDVL